MDKNQNTNIVKKEEDKNKNSKKVEEGLKQKASPEVLVKAIRTLINKEEK